jgi:hypothetical protein
MSGLAHRLPEGDRRRIVSAIRLFDSGRDGEALAAVRASARLLAPHGLTVAGLIEAALAPPPAVERIRVHPRGDHKTWTSMCLGHRELLNDWEANFLKSIRLLPSLSPKQRAKLDIVVAKLGEVA